MLAALAALVLQTQGTWAFVHPEDTFGANAMLDLRYLNEKAAGESGFVRLSPDGNSFQLGNGQPERFWAVVSDAYRLPPDQIASHARFLAKLGVNMVRLHTQLPSDEKGSKITDVNQKEIDGIWRCVAAMKKEGIYCTISPYWAANKEATDWGIDGYGHEGLWGILFFNQKLQDAYKSWVKSLYTRVNPYTGITLANDPAVAIIQVQNEDGMLFWTMQGMKPAQQKILGKKFGDWLVAKYGSLNAAKTAWDGTANDKDDFANGVVGLFNVYQMTQTLKGGFEKRVNDECEFYAETQRKFYSDIGAYYHKDLGCKQLINASNWITADPIKLNDIERWTYTANDVLAVNKYTGGTHVGDNNGWRIDPGHHFTNQSCLLDPRALPTNLKQVAGHPMIITESTWVSPEHYQSEGPMMMAAYESVTGIAGYYWFATGESSQYYQDPYFNFVNINGQHAMNKWSCSTPMLMGDFPANALMYRLGYLKQGPVVVHEERPVASLWRRETPIIAEDRTFDPNRDTGNTRGTSNLEHGVDPLAFLVGTVQITYSGSESNDRVMDFAHLIDHDAKKVTSATGEVSLDYGTGLLTINSVRAQGVCGFLSKAGDVALRDVNIHSNNDYASIELVSMDHKPLKNSNKILLQIGTTARPTGWVDKPADFKGDDGKQTFHGFEVVKTGSMPWQITDSDATITLDNMFITTATVLDTAGYPIKRLTGGQAGGKYTLKLPPNAMYIVLSSLTGHA